jgi:hypothetical protein
VARRRDIPPERALVVSFAFFRGGGLKPEL